ncbi:kelch repeat and BTB domain-containing protein 11 [Solea solea]|uniref:kelch repeat and BTB domain-containing protein 11 n=1 Tax=Solea solea TaxID=90069 RepID=UPI00272AB67E|nr:kelch repeat and BTB domain-containing protein 11 [Solea solea]XP_058472026.1 kelch repeat and BTB domain-containing protein 11 [Solea solea]
MDEGCRQGRGTFTVEADVILHTVNPDLVSPADSDGSLCPGYVQGYKDFSPAAVFEKEYLLDGRLTENNHIDRQKGNGSVDLRPHADSTVSNHVSGTQNCASSEIHNGARSKAPHGAEAESVLKSNRDAAAENAQDGKDPDLVIEVGGQTISAHKCVLAEKSDYFKARLSRDILKVKGVNYKTLSTLIDYVYTSHMNVSKDNVVDVIMGAKVLQIPCAVQAAMDSMSEQITAENCFEILTIAKKQRLSELKETAYGFMSDNFLQVLKDPAVYGRLNGSERDLILKKRMEGRKTLMVVETNDVFDRVGSRPPSRCGSRAQSPSSAGSLEENHMIYHFNEAANDWRPLTSMPEDITAKGCGICTMYNYLFVAGGIKGYGDKGKVSDQVFCYNPITNRWAEVRPLNQARAQLKLVSMDGCLYAIGGECLFTVEKYDPRMDRWTAVAPLPKGAFAVAHEATTCSGELYVSGGSLFYRLLKYDTKRDEWQECPYNNSRRKSSDMVAFKSFIYRFDVNRDQGINVYKYNTIVKMWHDCASQRLGSHLPFRCAVIGNCIYCVNKSQTLQFVVEEENAYFVEETLRAPLEAKGLLFPFVLTLPEKPEKVT